MPTSTYEKIMDTSKHGLIYGIGKILSTGIGFFLIPVYTRYLLTDEYGVLALLTITASIVSTIFSFNLGTALFRFYYDNDSKKHKDRVISTSFFVMLLSSIFLIIFGFFLKDVLSNIIFETNEYSLYIFLIFSASAGQLLSRIPYSLFRAEKRSTEFTVFNIISTIITLATIIFFVVVLKRGVFGVVLAKSITALFFALILNIYIIRRIKLDFSFTLSKDLLRYGIPLIFSGLAMMVLTWFDRYLLNIFSTLSEVGIYNLGYQISMGLQFLLMVPFKQIWAPMRFSVMEEDNAKLYYKRVLIYFSFLGIWIFLALSILSRDVLKIISNPEYHPAYKIIPIVSLAYLIFAIKSPLNLGIGFEKKTKYYALTVISGALVNLVLNLYLIPKYGAMGAAFATLIAFIIMVLLHYYINQMLYRIKYDWNRILHLAFVGGFVFIIGWYIPFDQLYVSLLSKTSVVLSFPLILYLTKFFEESEIEHVQKLISQIIVKVKSYFI